VFLASGTDLSDPDAPKPSVFTPRAGNRARAIIRQAQSHSPGVWGGATLRFVHFSFGGDQVEYYEYDPADKSPQSMNWRRSPFPWVKLEDSSSSGDPAYDPKTFVSVPVAPATMSIVDIYHSVRGAPPSSVLDLSIFSHAFIEGPVLVNTVDTEPDAFPDGSPQRTSTDRDGRVRTDFHPNMGEDPAVGSSGPIRSGGKDALAEFKAKFHPAGAFRVYGCDVQDVAVDPDNNQRKLLVSTVFQVLHQAYAKPIRAAHLGQTGTAADFGRRLLKGPVPESNTSVALNMAEEFANEAALPATDHAHSHLPVDKLRELHYGIDPTFFRDEQGMQLDRLWQELIQFIARRTMEIYVFKAADATGITCYGAVPGTGGEYEQAMADPQMRVCRQTGFGCSPGEVYTPYLKFYETFMDVSCTEPQTSAKLQRNYGIFDAAAVAALKDHAENG
jgi:hypothetical protein